MPARRSPSGERIRDRMIEARSVGTPSMSPRGRRRSRPRDHRKAPSGAGSTRAPSRPTSLHRSRAPGKRVAKPSGPMSRGRPSSCSVRILPPSLTSASMSTTRTASPPRRERVRAAVRPVMPPPPRPQPSCVYAAPSSPQILSVASRQASSRLTTWGGADPRPARGRPGTAATRSRSQTAPPAGSIAPDLRSHSRR